MIGKDLTKTATVKNLGIHVAADVSWKQHIEEIYKQENKVLYMLKRIVVIKVITFVILGFHESLILSGLIYVFTCLTSG